MISSTNAQHAQSRRDLWRISLAGGCIALFLLICSGALSSRISGEFSHLNESYTAQQVGTALGLFRLQEQRMIGLAVSRPIHLRLRQALRQEELSALAEALPADAVKGAGVEIASLYDKDGKLLFGQDWQTGQPRNLSAEDPVARFVQDAVKAAPSRGWTFAGEIGGRTFFFVLSSIGRFEPRDGERIEAYLALGRSIRNGMRAITDDAPYQIRFSEAKSFDWPIEAEPIWNPVWTESRARRSGLSAPPPGPNRRGPPPRGFPPPPMDNPESPLLSDLLLATQFFADPIPYPDHNGTPATRLVGKIAAHRSIPEMAVELLVPREISNSVNRSIGLVRTATVGAAALILIFTFAVVREARKRRSAEEELRASVSELREANLRKDQLLSIVAHDLRAPLTGVINLSDLMLKRPNAFSPEEIRGFASEIQTASKNLAQVLENLLCWARLKTNRLPYLPTPIDLQRLAHQTLALFQPVAGTRGIQLVANIDTGITITTDEEMLRTILRNLVSNAIRFNKDQGQVRLWVARQEGGVTIAVKDTGCGISASALSRLFQGEGHQTGAPDRPPGAGSGFGLQLAKELTERLGGKIEATSTVDAGSTFKVHLPDYSGPSRRLLKLNPSRDQSLDALANSLN